MANEKISVDDLLTEQSKQTISATVEAVESQPNQVTITPWTAAAGCLCHLAVQVAKSSLEGVSPTGDTHICCGKTLKVVQLHFKKGESIALEDLFLQLQAHASKTASFSDPVYSNRVEPHFFPPAPTPPGPHPPWPVEPYKRPGPNPMKSNQMKRFPWPGRYSLCEANHSRCLEHCQYSLHPEQCNCLCETSFLNCMGHPGIECPD